MVALVHVNAQLLQVVHVGLRLAVSGQGLVAATLGRLHRDRQLKAAEVDIVLRAPVGSPPVHTLLVCVSVTRTMRLRRKL